MIWSWESRWRADSGSGRMSRRELISVLIRSRLCLEAPLVDLEIVEKEKNVSLAIQIVLNVTGRRGWWRNV